MCMFVFACVSVYQLDMNTAHVFFKTVYLFTMQRNPAFVLRIKHFLSYIIMIIVVIIINLNVHTHYVKKRVFLVSCL